MLPEHLTRTQFTIYLAAGIALIALAVWVVVPWLRRLIATYHIGEPYLLAILDKGRNPARAFIAILGLRYLIRLVESSDIRWPSALNQLVSILLIGAVTWFLCAAIAAIEEVLIGRVSWDRAEGRRVATQLTLARRVATTIIVVSGIWTALMTFPQVRSVGQTLLASAGLISIIAGLAAQTTLTNVFAGIQIVVTNAIRVDDFVSVEGQPGRVDDITLTYVVIRPWDDRKVIYPASYFISNSFENWTQIGDPIQGSTEIDVDWTAPIDAMREELDRILAASEYWDGRTGTMQVTDVLEGSVRLLIVLSAASASDLFALQAEVREALVKYVVQHVPGAIPRSRYVMNPGAAAELEP